MILGIQPKSDFSSLTLSRKTCPLGLLVILSSNDLCSRPVVYNEEVSGSILENGQQLIERSEVVFLTANTGNIRRAIALAEHISDTGIRVVVGGPEPSMIGPRLLEDNPCFDTMVIGPGESVLPALFNREDHSAGPRVVWRDTLSDSDPLEYSPPFNAIDFTGARVDYSLLWDLARHEGLSYFWGNDCAQAQERCYFCGRLAMGRGFRPSAHVWDELLYAYRQGIRFFYNTTDSVTTDIAGFGAFCRAKPVEMCEDQHRVFVNSRDVNAELIEALRRLNGTAVIGVESFGRFAQVKKRGTTVPQSKRAIAALCRAGVRMVLSFVYGLPGETPGSIQENERGIIRLVSEYGDWIDAIHISPLLITTGSPAFRQLMNHDCLRRKYGAQRVPFDAVEMSEDYFKLYCDVTREFCIERILGLAQHIRSIAPHIRMGAKGVLTTEHHGVMARLNAEDEQMLFDAPLLPP